MKELLIIFARSHAQQKDKYEFLFSPVRKEEKEAFRKTFNHAFLVTCSLEKDTFLFYDNHAMLKAAEVPKKKGSYLKLGSDEGEKMFNAFLKGFLKEYTNIVLIRNASMELKKETVEKAFHMLRSNDYVVGPLSEGGCYLIGMKKLDPFLVEERTGREEVLFRNVINHIRELELSYHELPELKEVKEVVWQD